MAHASTTTASAARRVPATISDERTDNELLAAHAAGDTAAFGKFVRRYDHFLVAAAARRIGAEHWHDAEDAAAETWIAIMGKAADLGPEGVGDVKNWLASFVRNHALRISADYARRQTSARDPHVLGRVISEQGYRLPGAAAPLDLEGQDDRDDRDDREARADMLAARFAHALSELPALQREVMTYRLRERDLTARQIAAELGATLAAVKGAEQAGRRTLRRALGDLVGEPTRAAAPATGQELIVDEPVTGAGLAWTDVVIPDEVLARLSPRRKLLIERLRDNPAMSGPEAATVLEQAGLGQVSRQRAYKMLTAARLTLTEAAQPGTAPTRVPKDQSGKPVPAKVRAARLLVLTAWLRENPALSGIKARRELCEAGLGPIAEHTARRLLTEARERAAGTNSG